jgi:hypothetical protein
VSFATITFCVAFQRVFVVSVYFVTDSVWKLSDGRTDGHTHTHTNTHTHCECTERFVILLYRASNRIYISIIRKCGTAQICGDDDNESK